MIPSLSSFCLIKIKLAAPAEEPANIARNEFAKIRVGPFRGANYFANIFLVKSAMDIDTATAPEYPFPKSLIVYELDAFLLP